MPSSKFPCFFTQDLKGPAELRIIQTTEYRLETSILISPSTVEICTFVPAQIA